MKNRTDKSNKVDIKSPDLRQEVLDKFKKLYPPLFDNEGMLNQEELEQLVKDFSTPQTEKYEFNWAGKQQAKKNAFTRSKATLRSDEKRSVDFDKTENLIIEGDNLEVLKLLQKSYFGKIKCIYIDPPYNTGNDFIYPDDYSQEKQAYWEKSGVKQEGVKLDTNTDSSGRYHSNWLSMMCPRLLLARNLLKEDGVIFVSIDDNEVHNLMKILDETFGEENFVAQIPWRKRTAKSDVPFGVSQDFEWILVYSKSELFKAKIKGKERKYYETDDLPGRSWRIHGMTTQRTANERPNSDFALINPKNGEKYPVNPNAVWRITKDSYKEFLKEKRIVFPGDYDFLDISQPVLRYFKDEDLKNDGESFGYAAVSTLLPVSVGMTLDGTKEMAELFENRIFSFPKPKNLIKFLIEISTDITKDIVLDFFAGSGTTAHAVIELNKENESRRKFILVQIPEATDEKSDAYKAGYKTISDICIERVKRAGKKLKDGAKDLDVGFKVFRLASSHFPENTFAPDPDKSDEQNIKALEEYIKKATSQKSLFRDGVMDLVYEIALKDGFELTLTMEEAKEFNKNTIYKVADSYKEAFICVDDSLEDTTIRQLDQHKGSRFICLHTSVNTTKKWNLQNVLGSNLWLI